MRELLNKYAGYDLKKDEILLFNIGGTLYYISDIGMRMLTPRELYDAQGFPHDYQIEFDFNGKAVYYSNINNIDNLKRIYKIMEG